MESCWNPKSNTLENGWQHDHRPATCVIARQHSSAIFFSLSFKSRTENIDAPFENNSISIVNFSNLTF
jgi:hypothetical protein